MIHTQIEKISTQRFSEVDFLSVGPSTSHVSCHNANQYVKRNIDYIAPEDVNNILILDVTWHSEIDAIWMEDLFAGKLSYDYILLYNMFDGYHTLYQTYYYKLKENYKVNFIGPQPLEPENFFNFHEYNVASWITNYPTQFVDNFMIKFDSLPDHYDFSYNFLYYAGGFSDDRLQFINHLNKNQLLKSNNIITMGIQGGMSDSDGTHYPDNFGTTMPWDQSIVNLVSETRNGTVLNDDFPGCFVTEKTFKPIFAHMPFIHINQPEKFTRFFTESCGYKLYNSFFDIPDHEPTNQEVCDALIRLSNMTPREKSVFYKSMLSTIQYNYNNLQERSGRIHNMFSNRSA